MSRVTGLDIRIHIRSPTCKSSQNEYKVNFPGGIIKSVGCRYNGPMIDPNPKHCTTHSLSLRPIRGGLLELGFPEPPTH